MIVKYGSSRKELWDEYLDTCVFGYYTSCHESSLHTIDFVGGLNKHRQEILERVEKNISIALKRQKTANDRKHANPCKFQVWCKYAYA